MKLNYFDKYSLDTDEIKEKLEIISKCNEENASYITYMLNNALEYLYSEVQLNVENMTAGITDDLQEVNTIIIFDMIEENEIPSWIVKSYQKANLIIIGNYVTKCINDKVIFINVEELAKIRRVLEGEQNILIGFNVSKIDFTKYYYSRMRSYFLNVVDALDKVSMNELKEDTELVCKNILINDDNFESKKNVPIEKIEFKAMMNMYKEIVKLKSENIINKAFYVHDDEVLQEDEKMALNQISLLIKVFNIEDEKEKLSFVYDTFCENMMKEISRLNYCYFIDNKCIKMRYTSGFPNSKENGCCSNTYMDKRKDCRYLKADHSCAICSISCRVFTCLYLQERGIDHSLWQYPIIDCTLNKLSRAKIIHNFFTPKEKIMQKLHYKLK